MSHAAAEGLAADELAFLDALEAIIRRALQRHPPGAPFVYGIHQGLTPAMAEQLLSRYRAAGWGQARLLKGATGAHTLLLAERAA